MTTCSSHPVLVALFSIVVWTNAVPIGLAQPDTPRKWTDTSGKFSVVARLAERTGEAVVLVTEDGRRITVPLARLSAADREFLKTDPPVAPATNNALPRYANPQTYRMRIGAEVTASGGACNNVVVTFPLPMSWPEQRVTEIEREVSPKSMRINRQVLDDGVEQIEFRAGRLTRGSTARVVFTVEIERSQIRPPIDSSQLTIPTQLTSDLKRYLGESPMIETSHATVREAAESIVLDEKTPAWNRVEAIYDWTIDRIKPGGTKPLKGALHGLMSGKGDCEERTSLFVAICRLKRIPARSVWSERHAYPEFYLEHAPGRGFWYPCESLGERHFGGMPRYNVVLQKGDRFRMKQKRGPQRYVTSTLSGSVGSGGAQPVLREIRERVTDQR